MSNLTVELNRTRDKLFEAYTRIEQLEAALRDINDICHDPDHEAACMATIAVARNAIAQSSPPKAST